MTEIRWERRGLVHVPIIDDPAPKPRGPRPKNELWEWSDKDLREAHRLFMAGERDLWTREGERVYQQRRKRAQRAGVMSRADLRWAEKNAVKSSWRIEERRNRLA